MDAARIITAGIALAALGLASLPAQAADGERLGKLQDQLQARFAAADSNGDGRLSEAEAAGKLPRVASHFQQIDREGKGYVTLEDIRGYTVERLSERRPGAAGAAP